MAVPRSASIGRGDEQEISLLEILDNVLNSGVVVQGSIVISLAGVDLVYIGLSLVLTSVETALKHLPPELQPARHIRRR
ncbi:MAG TPA: gas vesicle protein [Terriglobales bacterium]|nr:gas vesicle protein [Terriglobales bacterium]